MSVTVTPDAGIHPVGVLIGLSFLPMSTPFGDLVASPDVGYGTPGGTGLISFTVPVLLELVDTVLVAQVVTDDCFPACPQLGSVSFGMVRR